MTVALLLLLLYLQLLTRLHPWLLHSRSRCHQAEPAADLLPARTGRPCVVLLLAAVATDPDQIPCIHKHGPTFTLAGIVQPVNASPSGQCCLRCTLRKVVKAACIVALHQQLR